MSEFKIIKHEVEPIFSSLERKDKFKKEMLTTINKSFSDGMILSTKHYRLSETMTVEEYEDRFEDVVQNFKRQIKNTLEYSMYLCKSGVVCFSPANMLSECNQEAQEWYLFEYRNDIKNTVELYAETNFICVNLEE